MARANHTASCTYQHLWLYLMVGFIYMLLTSLGTKALHILEERGDLRLHPLTRTAEAEAMIRSEPILRLKTSTRATPARRFSGGVVGTVPGRHQGDHRAFRRRQSTLLHCINFLVSFEQGTVWLHDRKIEPADKLPAFMSTAEDRKIFRDFNLFDHLTALGNVQIGLVRVKKIATRGGNGAWPSWPGWV
jgi:hypothetical protein